MRSALLSLALALPLPLYAALSTEPPQERRAVTGQEPATGDPKRASDEPQEEGTDVDKVDIYGRPLRTQGKSSERRLLQGCWKLTEVELAGLVDRGRKAVGALLVHDEFLAFELHMTWPGRVYSPTVYQSYIAEYEFTRGRQLKVTTVVGSFIDQRVGGLDWEETGFAREYQVSVTGDRLVLTFGQGNSMSFARQRATGQGGRDIFGRKRLEASGERDIFGRPKARSEDAEGGDKTGIPAPGGGEDSQR